MSLLRVYEGAKGPTDGPTAGARVLMAWYLGLYGSRGGRNLGIYNPKRIAGPGSAWSLHAEGRADDLGVPDGDPEWAHQLAERLRAYSAEIGIQLVIYRRRVWSSAHPDDGWRAYSGSNPHTDHLHVELSWAAARSLTAQTLQIYVAGVPAPPAPRGGPRPGSRTLRLTTPNMIGEDVEFLQRFIGPAKCGAPDGVYGPHTANGVRWYQGMRGIAVDGVAGPQTWANVFSRQ